MYVLYYAYRKDYSQEFQEMEEPEFQIAHFVRGFIFEAGEHLNVSAKACEFLSVPNTRASEGLCMSNGFTLLTGLHQF
jgi:hypothetical protein